MHVNFDLNMFLYYALFWMTNAVNPKQTAGFYSAEFGWLSLLALLLFVPTLDQSSDLWTVFFTDVFRAFLGAISKFLFLRTLWTFHRRNKLKVI